MSTTTPIRPYVPIWGHPVTEAAADLVRAAFYANHAPAQAEEEEAREPDACECVWLDGRDRPAPSTVRVNVHADGSVSVRAFSPSTRAVETELLPPGTLVPTLSDEEWARVEPLVAAMDEGGGGAAYLYRRLTVPPDGDWIFFAGIESGDPQVSVGDRVRDAVCVEVRPGNEGYYGCWHGRFVRPGGAKC